MLVVGNLGHHSCQRISARIARLVWSRRRLRRARRRSAHPAIESHDRQKISGISPSPLRTGLDIRLTVAGFSKCKEEILKDLEPSRLVLLELPCSVVLQVMIPGYHSFRSRTLRRQTNHCAKDVAVEGDWSSCRDTRNSCRGSFVCRWEIRFVLIEFS